MAQHTDEPNTVPELVNASNTVYVSSSKIRLGGYLKDWHHLSKYHVENESQVSFFLVSLESQVSYCQGKNLQIRGDENESYGIGLESENSRNSCFFFLMHAAATAAKSLQSCPALCDSRDSSPTRLPRPWDSQGKNTGVGCHFLLQCMKVKSESEVAQSCPTLSDPMDCNPPGSSIHGIFQAIALEWADKYWYAWISIYIS